MGKPASSHSQSTPHAASWGAVAALNRLKAELDLIENTASLVDDRLKYVHVILGFYYKCADDLKLCRGSTADEGVKNDNSAKW
jgi:hypothetical protein